MANVYNLQTVVVKKVVPAENQSVAKYILIVHVDNTNQVAERSKRGIGLDCVSELQIWGSPKLVRQRYTNPFVMWVYSPHLRIVIGLL